MITAENARIISEDAVLWAAGQISDAVYDAATLGYKETFWKCQGIFDDRYDKRAEKLRQKLYSVLEENGYTVDLDVLPDSEDNPFVFRVMW